MKIKLITVGNSMPKWVHSGYQEYQKRFGSELQLQLIEIASSKRRNHSVEQCLQQEAAKMLPYMQQKNTLNIALAVNGKAQSSEKLASCLQDWLFSGKTINLLIGGPDGIAPQCLRAADSHWSLSTLTLPHPLVRLIVVEQLYRAWTIIKGHPYHRA